MRGVSAAPAPDVGAKDEDCHVREQPQIAARGNLLPGASFFMAKPHRSLGRGLVLGQNPLLQCKTRMSAIAGGGHK
ncbi:MAG: hypothetical protein C0524_09600 [Rhodobacter sp.]|nr:hypothetical protein [Rhodobacter sp.]